MPVVNGKITRPDLTKQAASVEFELVDQFGNPVRAWKSATDETIISRQPVALDPSTGAYTITIPGNVDLNPANTRWRRRIFMGQDIYTDFLVVPTGGGPYQEEDIAQDIVPLPVPTPSNELDVAEITGAVNGLAVNGFNLVAVPGLVVTVPDSSRPVYLFCKLWMQHSVANVVVASIIAAVGSTTIGQQVDGALGHVGTIGFEAAPLAWARLNPHTPGDYQAFVWSNTTGSMDVLPSSGSKISVLGV